MSSFDHAARQPRSMVRQVSALMAGWTSVRLWLMAGAFAATAVALPSTAQADIGSELENFWTRTGGASNVTRPQAFLGQQAGYVTGGSLVLRTQPRNTQFARLTLPRIRSGCGGIDMFMGSFSFISADELIALAEAIMQNAPGFAFELALQSLSPSIQEVVGKLRDLAQKVNSMNINSCEASQALVGSIWPKTDNASQYVCKAVGVERGFFQDIARSRHGCGSENQQNATLAGATDELKDQVPLDVNYAWKAIKKHPYLRANTEVAEMIMSLSGTVITRKNATDPDKTDHVPYPPMAFTSASVAAFIEGGSLRVLKCDESDKCLHPSWVTITIAEADAFYTRVNTLVAALATAIRTDTAPPAGAQKLVGLTSTPVFSLLVEAISARYIFTDDEVSILSELVAIELAMHFTQEGLKEVAQAASHVDIFGDHLKEFQTSVTTTINQFGVMRQEARQSYQQAMTSMERVSLVRSEAASLTATRFGAQVRRD